MNNICLPSISFYMFSHFKYAFVSLSGNTVEEKEKIIGIWAAKEEEIIII